MLLIHAQEDPFVPAVFYVRGRWSSEPRLTPLLPKSGDRLGRHDRLGIWQLRRIEAFFAGC